MLKQEKLFIAEYTKEALKQFSELDIDNQEKYYLQLNLLKYWV